MFGTCGIRKKYSNYDRLEQTFTPSMALRLGLALGTYMVNNDQYKVVIGRDVRTTALPIELALTSGLISTGCQVFTIGCVSTPTLCLSIDYLHSDCGIMITASHNPPEYIGVKFFGPRGLGFSPSQEAEIESIYQNRAFVEREWNRQGTVSQVERMNDVHAKKVLKAGNYNKTDLPIKVIIDPGNGSASIVGPLLVGKMGLKYITLNSQPDGYFPGRFSEPSEKNLKDLISIVKREEGLDLGIAFDGDADRIVFLDENGQLVEPIRLLTFLAKEFVISTYPDPTTRPPLSVVTPVNSSGVIEYILEPLGVKVFRTKVGDINVSLEMQKQNSFLGGENCGVFIWPEFSGHLGPDCLMPILKVIQALTKYKVQFSLMLEEIPEFPYKKTEFTLKKDMLITSDNYKIFTNELKDKLSSMGYLNFKENNVDGIHIRFDKGWILLRKSGTSPVMRITAEMQTHMEDTDKIIQIAYDILSKHMEFIAE